MAKAKTVVGSRSDTLTFRRNEEKVNPPKNTTIDLPANPTPEQINDLIVVAFSRGWEAGRSDAAKCIIGSMQATPATKMLLAQEIGRLRLDLTVKSQGEANEQ